MLRILKVLRKPTIGVFWVGVVLAALYGLARHDLWQRCPDLRGDVPAFSNPLVVNPKVRYFDAMCTDQDPAYVDMEEYQLALEMAFVVLLVLLVTDVTYYSLGESRRLRHRRRRRSGTAKGTKFLVRISRFFGGL